MATSDRLHFQDQENKDKRNAKADVTYECTLSPFHILPSTSKFNIVPTLTQ